MKAALNIDHYWQKWNHRYRVREEREVKETLKMSLLLNLQYQDLYPLFFSMLEKLQLFFFFALFLCCSICVCARLTLKVNLSFPLVQCYLISQRPANLFNDFDVQLLSLICINLDCASVLVILTDSAWAHIQQATCWT